MRFIFNTVEKAFLTQLEHCEICFMSNTDKILPIFEHFNLVSNTYILHH
jgi:hypothetical protein